ncbi:hypothetical protein U1Q18_029646 [Sarracenia purpurea var. burkii]
MAFTYRHGQENQRTCRRRPPRDQNGKSKIQNRKHRSDLPLMSLVLMDLPLKGSDEMVTKPKEEAAAVVMVSEAAEAKVELDLTGLERQWKERW